MSTQRYLTRQQKAMQAAYRRALDEGATRTLDIAQDRYVIFSDLHRGVRNKADDFRPCERAYNAALAYYLRLGYFLAILGDAEDMWAESAGPIIATYRRSLDLEAQFHREGRYLRLWGNHDDDWQDGHSVARHLAPVFREGPPLQVRESALVRVEKDGQELGRLFLIHGHQGDRVSAAPSPLQRFAIRHLWRPLQRLLHYSPSTPAQDGALGDTYDKAMYYWARRENALVLIAGHTHRPVFRSASHAAQVRQELAQLEQRGKAVPGRQHREAQAALLAQLEWIRAQAGRPPRTEDSTPVTVPCYFNAGCCCFGDGDITGIEIADGEIRLVRWPDKAGRPQPWIMAATPLEQVLEECHYRPGRVPRPAALPAESKPIIDVHAHVFRGKDIPLTGYLLARRYDQWLLQRKAVARFLLSRLSRCIRDVPPEQRGLLCQLVLRLAYKVTGQGYRNWADILALQEPAAVAREMVQTFDKDGISLYVPLMIDYAYWFENSGEPHLKDQIAAIYEHVVLPYQGRIHPFVPFDPARELAFQHGIPGPNGKLEPCSAMELVRDAIVNKGFIGIKIYNTLGYRPLGNAAVEEHRRRIYRENGLQRYLQEDAQRAFSGAEIDRVLEELYRFCVQEQVPITAHCVSNGIEAYWKASFDFARPEYWKAVLEKYPELHVNLGHFGWDHAEGYYPAPSRWGKVLGAVLRGLGRGEEKTWVRVICEMLDSYPHLFVDVAHHGVTESQDRPKYQAAYQGICHDFPGLLQQRLLFGIDWHVIARVENYTEFKDRYVELLLAANVFTEDDIYDFLGGNALRFLGLLPLGTAPDKGWTKNRERLANFYRQHQIPPPAWFTATDAPAPPPPRP